MNNILLELHYLPNIQYFSKIIAADKVWIEAHENYQKRSYRNRTEIASANGLLRLSIPLQKGKNEQQSIRDVKIAYEETWQSQHWHAIQSAYRNAPYFDFYADELKVFYKEKTTFLFEYNWKLLELMLGFVDPSKELIPTDQYQKQIHPSTIDFRNKINPRKPQFSEDPSFNPARYVQVFEDKHGFLPNLSILDLLFCMGPSAILILEQSIQ
ncbi:MAG: WbqC family protein [Bacteroidota bacterium]